MRPDFSMSCGPCGAQLGDSADALLPFGSFAALRGVDVHQVFLMYGAFNRSRTKVIEEWRSPYKHAGKLYIYNIYRSHWKVRIRGLIFSRQGCDFFLHHAAF